MTNPKGFTAYIFITAAYWSFMLTDGALRMLVLLHFHILGFTPIQLAYLFLIYEIAGIATNLYAGWIAARFGLPTTLYAGLLFQVLALLALAQLDPTWSITASVVFVMTLQGLSGVAKDLTKMSAKSAVKILAPSESEGLFRWVAILTGSKNSVKGAGFLLGTLLLGIFGFAPSLLAMAAILFLILIGILFTMPTGLPVGRKGVNLSEIFSTNQKINLLSVARLFLFGARDVWFVVGIPIYFYAVFSDGSDEGNRTAFFVIGAFMALWTISYGIIQGWAPRFLKAQSRTDAQMLIQAKRWVSFLVYVPALLAIFVWFSSEPSKALTAIIILGLIVFGIIFAVNSSLHSFLILSFTNTDRVTMDVGFYYMANAAGRLVGTILSGLTYQLGGLPLCLCTAAIMIAFSLLATSKLIKRTTIA
ncbi:organoarsenical effux MFS transporter ArsJ [Planktomarina sp.]|nr:organoarsenical effux MFS transporter ArsJ [Planktomarina sp.]MDA9100191.1 organoarsenical effux MFS transporter ArsJ [Planktomarina sp.]